MDELEDKDFLFQILKVKSLKWYLVPHPFHRLVAWDPYIYVPYDMHILLMNDPCSADLQSQFIHAYEHLYRQRQLGKVRWLIKYWLSKRFRFDEEIGAIYAEMKFLKKNGFEYDIYKGAEFLSSGWYKNMTTFDKAKLRLLGMWKEI